MRRAWQMLAAAYLALAISPTGADDQAVAAKYILGLDFESVASDWLMADACEPFGAFRRFEVEALKDEMIALGERFSEEERDEHWTMVQRSPSAGIINSGLLEGGYCHRVRVLIEERRGDLFRKARADYPFD